MKKFYFLLPILLLTSCAKVEEDTSAEDNPILVTKMVQDGDNYTFSYNGAKIVTMTNTTDNFKRTYTYSGDLITKYLDTFADGSTQTTNVTYNSSNKILKKSSTYQGGTYTTDYAYIGADRVRITVVLAQTNSTKTYVKDVYLNTDGSLKNWTETVADVKPTTTQNGTGILKNVAYDGGSFPFKNITGYTRLLESEEMNGSTRNVIDYNNRIQYTNIPGDEWTIYHSTYEYNTNGYPKKDTKDSYEKTGTSITKTEITTYEYNHL